MFPLHRPRSGNSILTATALLGLTFSTFILTGCRHKNPMPTASEENTPIGGAPISKVPVDVPPVTGAPSGSPTIPGGDDKMAAPAIKVEVSADKAQYGRGDVVTFTLTARNSSDQPQAITFRSGRNFDFSATREGKTEATWRWSRGKMFTMALRTITLLPGEVKTFSGTWEQRGEDGPAARGRYTVVGELAIQPRVLSAPLSIELID